ncbi:MAG: hypothetical protein AVDCRST_MAG59-1372, partial [uncultured Thermomicrobiales bacterium]
GRPSRARRSGPTGWWPCGWSTPRVRTGRWCESDSRPDPRGPMVPWSWVPHARPPATGRRSRRVSGTHGGRPGERYPRWRIDTSMHL